MRWTRLIADVQVAVSTCETLIKAGLIAADQLCVSIIIMMMEKDRQRQIHTFD